MKAMIRHVTDGDIRYDALAFMCPGCAEFHTGLHMLPVNSTVKQPSWDWDGNLESPTLNPSILTNGSFPDRRCHSYLHNGVFQFLGDCAHSLANQHVPMGDLPDWFVNESEES